MKLSVSLITFDHADTAAEALDGALAQRTDFPFEIVAGDDASTDGTRDLLLSYRARHPDRIRLLLRESNAGDVGLTNFMATIEVARGDYVALLDGDDYWTSPDKLRCQVAFLDAHPDCAICAHRVEHVDDTGGRVLSAASPNGTGTYPVGALILRNFAPKVSTVIRRSAFDDLPDWYGRTTVASADWLLNLLVSRNARIGFIDKVMAVHRVHAASVSANYGAERIFADKLEILKMIEEHIPEASGEIRRAERQLRLKRRLAGASPRAFSALRRLAGRLRSAPTDRGKPF